jgi:hypothetical protein
MKYLALFLLALPVISFGQYNHYGDLYRVGISYSGGFPLVSKEAPTGEDGGSGVYRYGKYCQWGGVNFALSDDNGNFIKIGLNYARRRQRVENFKISPYWGNHDDWDTTYTMDKIGNFVELQAEYQHNLFEGDRISVFFSLGVNGFYTMSETNTWGATPNDGSRIENYFVDHEITNDMDFGLCTGFGLNYFLNNGLSITFQPNYVLYMDMRAREDFLHFYNHNVRLTLGINYAL